MEQPIQTAIWHETPEADNPFATQTARCHGYDVYGQMLGHCRWVDMLYLLLRGEAAPPAHANLLEDLAVALANPGPRDASVHAAMCGGVGKSVAASSLMAALAVGAGQYSGAREVFLLVQQWRALGTDIASWEVALTTPHSDVTVSTWPAIDHTPGFDPYGTTSATIVIETLNKLTQHLDQHSHLHWLQQYLPQLERVTGQAATMMLVAATAFVDLGFSAEQAEMLTLLLRLPGAAAHALEQQQIGHKKFPFYAVDLQAHTAEPTE